MDKVPIHQRKEKRRKKKKEKAANTSHADLREKNPIRAAPRREREQVNGRKKERKEKEKVSVPVHCSALLCSAEVWSSRHVT